MSNETFDKERIWYVGFCTSKEIDRILNPQNPYDFLLQERANIIADHMRYYRVYRNKARMTSNWSLEKSFSQRHYTDIIANLSDDDKNYCDKITYGDMFSNDVNGYAAKKNWGRVICLNESLKFFMNFCNLALFEFKYEVPLHVRVNSMRIAIRIFFKKESMDFLMDPRGIIPKVVANKIFDPVIDELQFIAGHEFSHHLCGHLNDNNTSEKNFLSINNKEYSQQIYNTSQKQEFEADLSSLTRPKYTKNKYSKQFEAALLWFITLELSELAQNIISPMSPFSIKTHPSAKDRFDNIMEHAPHPDNFDFTHINKIQENVNVLKDILTEDISSNFDNIYDYYGSVYLDTPNSEWRGRELIDRVDYY